MTQGINFFDTANMYSEGCSEEVLGAAIKDFTSRDQVSSVDVCIASGSNVALL
jgi:aryl-alcohol dehydrogenase-like predicted oxidoreductase